MYPKFIIENKQLIMGKCQYHKQLTSDVENVKGGGWFLEDVENKTIVFYGRSEDFGKLSFEDIQEAVLNDKIIYRKKDLTDYKFYYDPYDIGRKETLIK